jgi:hypothetical protein
VPCPLCGGLIHPVAGRCKHCKQDLTAFRAGRPQAPIPLPALDGNTPARESSNGHGRAAPAPAPAPGVPAMLAAHDASQPILPPRPTGRSIAAQAPRAAWLSWPVVVIILAVLAIVTATVVMVWPQSSEDRGKKMNLPAPPAPERMNVDPLPKQHSQIDPWQSHGDDPDPAAPVDPFDDQLDDLLGGGGGVVGGLGLGGLGGLTGPGMPSGAGFMYTMLQRACKKLETCPAANHAMLTIMCDQFASLPTVPPPSNCPAAQRCLTQIDGLDCAASANTNPTALVWMFTDCSTAVLDC